MLPFGIICTFLTIAQITTAESKDLPNGLTCLSDYWVTVRCFLNTTVISSVSESTSYWLEFVYISERLNFNCTLSAVKDGYNCSFTAKLPYRSNFMRLDTFHVYLCDMTGCGTSTQGNWTYLPSQNIKPTTPFNLMVGYGAGHYNFTWKSGYKNHSYDEILPYQYTLSYHKTGHPEQALSLTVGRTTTFSIPEGQLDSGAEYIARVCNEIKTSPYNGTTSDWSAAFKWNTSHPGPRLNQYNHVENSTMAASIWLQDASKIGIAVGLAVALLFGCGWFLALFPAARNKIKEITWVVATPEPYFQQLYQKHQGNFQGWVSKGQYQQTYSEEISTIDMITEITALKEEEEKVLNPAVQYHTPYVGPSTEVWLPFLKCDKRNSVNTPKDLDLIPEEPTDEDPGLCLNLPTAVECFLSLEILEPQQEICQPSETLAITPCPAAFNQNYCTLTNTDIGLVPTFTTPPCDPGSVMDPHISTLPLNIQTEEDTSEVVTLTLDSLELTVLE